MFRLIKTFPRFALEPIKHTAANSPNTIIISINDVGDPLLFPKEEFSKNYNIYSFVFSDINPRIAIEFDYFDKVRLLTAKDAEKIVHLLSNFHRSAEEWNLLIHCSAGICRSGAVARFAQMISGYDKKKFAKDNPNILPNEWILNTLFAYYILHENLQDNTDDIY